MKNLFFLLAVAVITNGQCPICVSENKASTITCELAKCINKPPEGYKIDSYGKYQDSRPHKECTATCRCSRGHRLKRLTYL